MFLTAHQLTRFEFVKRAPEVFEFSGMTFMWPIEMDWVCNQKKTTFFLDQRE